MKTEEKYKYSKKVITLAFTGYHLRGMRSFGTSGHRSSQSPFRRLTDMTILDR